MAQRRLDFLSNVTAPIQTITDDGKTVERGTCFFYQTCTEFAYLVTNWHIVTGRDPVNPAHSKTGAIPTKAQISMHKNVGNGQYSLSQKINLELPINSSDGENPRWLEHPIHRFKCDICVLKIPLKDESLSASYFTAISNWPEFSSNLEPYVTADIFVVGYPWGLSGGNNILPLYKRGSIASEPIIDQNKLPRLLVDCRTTPGNSGSPVICSHSGIYNPGGRLSDDGFIGRIRMFLGIYGGRLTPGELESINAATSEVSEIGVVWKASAIKEIVDAGTIGTKVSAILVA